MNATASAGNNDYAMAAEHVEEKTDIIRFGDDAQMEDSGIDYSTWAYDPNTLYKEDTYQLSQFGSAVSAGLDTAISIPDKRMEVAIEKIDPFQDAGGSGKYGIAVIYRITNTSDTIIFLSEDTTPPVLLFSPTGVLLKSHYDLQTVEPTAEQEYEGRITYPQELYNPSMKSMEIPANSTVTVYRMYDFAGPGTYNLYVATDKFGDPLEGSAVYSFELSGSAE